MKKITPIIFIAAVFLAACVSGVNLPGMAVGTKEYLQGDYPAAIGQFQEALARDPADPTALRMLGWSYYRMGEYPRAEEAFMDYGRHYPAEPEVYKGLAWCHYQMGEFTRSVNEYQKWLSIAPQSQEAREGLASCYIELGQDTTAMEHMRPYYKLEELPLKFPRWHYPFLLLGQKGMEEKNYGAAHHNFQAALQLKTDSPVAVEGIKQILSIGEKRLELARQYQEKERYKVAIRFYSQISGEFPFWAEPYIGMGECFIKMNSFNEAEASFRKALYLEPGSEKAKKWIRETVNQRDPNLKAARASLEKGEYLDAVASFEIVTKGPALYNVPEDERWAVFQGLGSSYQGLGKMEEAREYFQEALRLKQNDPESLKGLGLTYYHDKKYATAEMFLEMAEKYIHKDHELSLALGWTYSSRGKFEKASEQFDTALSLLPNDPKAIKGLAWAVYKSKDKERAKTEFQRLLELEPDYMADEEFQQLVLQNSSWWELSNQLGWRYYKEKNTAKAATAFLSSLEHAPGNPQALQGLGFVRFREKNCEEAAQRLKTVLDAGKETAPISDLDVFDSNAKVLTNAREKLAWSYYFTSKFKEAAEDFQKVIKLHSDWAGPVYGLALAQQKLKQYDEADKNFKTVLTMSPGHALAKAGIEDNKKSREEDKKKSKKKKSAVKKKDAEEKLGDSAGGKKEVKKTDAAGNETKKPEEPKKTVSEKEFIQELVKEREKEQGKEKEKDKEKALEKEQEKVKELAKALEKGKTKDKEKGPEKEPEKEKEPDGK
ncbi:MAG: tetratricopeptide repeat protein [Nitrospinae bacterium]|nr:tetratricopeptide repeat protein [Nitrospinota bacterium]